MDWRELELNSLFNLLDLKIIQIEITIPRRKRRAKKEFFQVKR